MVCGVAGGCGGEADCGNRRSGYRICLSDECGSVETLALRHYSIIDN
jgi:hypothetical protein